MTLSAAGRCVLGLDVGDRRVGVAVSDATGTRAMPLLTLQRKTLRHDLRFLARLAKKYSCAELVVGHPLHLSGDISPQALKAQAFAAALQEESAIPVRLWDERLSTAEAHRHLGATGLPPKARRAVIDQVSAVLILQGYLDARATAAAPP